MRRLLTFLAVALLLALPVVALAQAPTPTPAAPVIFSADPVGYVEAHWYEIALGLFFLARVVVRYVPKPAEGTFWATVYHILEHVSLPTPQTNTPAGTLTKSAALVAAVTGQSAAGPPAQPPPAEPPA